jgi:hypothetical protein
MLNNRKLGIVLKYIIAGTLLATLALNVEGLPTNAKRVSRTMFLLLRRPRVVTARQCGEKGDCVKCLSSSKGFYS